MSNQGFSRRDFVKSASVAGISAGLFASHSPAAPSKSPNEKLNIAIVGVAHKGRHNLDQLTQENIAVLCDVDANYLAKASSDFPAATTFADYRKMLDDSGDSIDAVVVSTADHQHAPATSLALDAGKHVYCEKPLTHTVQEARLVAELAAKKGVATQMGTQIHAGNNYRRVVEIVQSGVLGEINNVYCWCNKGWANGKFGPAAPVPAHLDWDLWLGPAKERPYSANIHPSQWRRFWEYGAGTFGDMACHVVDLPFWALGLKYPYEVSCEGPEVDPVGAPAWTKAKYSFAKSDTHSDLTLHWSDGGAHFPLIEATLDHSGKPLSKWGLGIMFKGSKGSLVADYDRYQLFPKDKFADFQPPEQTIPNSVGHWREWVNGCKTGSPTTCDFRYSGPLTETVLIGIVAYRTGKTLNWDAPNLTATNVPAAEQYLKKEYRQGWKVLGA